MRYVKRSRTSRNGVLEVWVFGMIECGVEGHYETTKDGTVWVGSAVSEVTNWKDKFNRCAEELEGVRLAKGKAYEALDEARATLTRALADLRQADEQLRVVQARCTELLEETRKLRKEGAK